MAESAGCLEMTSLTVAMLELALVTMLNGEVNAMKAPEKACQTFQSKSAGHPSRLDAPRYPTGRSRNPPLAVALAASGTAERLSPWHNRCGRAGIKRMPNIIMTNAIRERANKDELGAGIRLG
jgi:hypothetical protein